MEGYIYLIKSVNNNKYYLGSTNRPADRVKEHNNGKNKTTKKYLPWVCLAIIKVGDIRRARQIEYYIKRQKEKLSIENVIKSLNRFFTN